MGIPRLAFIPTTSVGCACYAASNSSFLNPRRAPRVLPTARPRSAQVRISAIQLNAVTGTGNDGDVRKDSPEKSFSVGVTIVSGDDAELRRCCIENIVSGCSGKRVVVVTASGITSTREQDGVRNKSSDIARVSVVEHGSSQDDVSLGESAKQLQLTENLEGWLSCSSYDEMAQVISKLASSRECDYIVAEGATSTSFGPEQIAALFSEKGGASLRVDTLVSVLDGTRVLDDLRTEPSTNGVDNGNNYGNGTSVENRPMLVVSLLENANVIVLNHDDEPSALEPVQNLISVLNRRASILPAKACLLPVDEVVNTNLYNSEDLKLSATWKLMLLADRAGQSSSSSSSSQKSLPKSLKDSSFVYRARRPFHPTRLFEHIQDVQTFSGVIRSTGTIWLATRMLAPLEWNQAGESATLQLGKKFYAEIPESEWPSDERTRNAINEKWDTQFGDRETELVFVGMDVDKERLQGLLDGCLLQDEEMVFTNLWENFDDPFIEWVPLIEEDEEVGDDDIIDEALNNINSNNVAEEIESNAANAANTRSNGTVASVEQPESDVQQTEGAVDEKEVAGILEKNTALDALLAVATDVDDISSSPLPLPADDGVFDEEDVVLSSGEGSVADGILRQIPKVGLPTTILTGFLGSGKTTVLNYILKAPHGLRIAVLVNEFGEIDIDSQLVQGDYTNEGGWDNNEVMELSNGCICCSINDSFVNAVRKILEKKDKFDYLIIETTGLADPVPILNSLHEAEDISEQIRVDGVLCLVDASMMSHDMKPSEMQLSRIYQSQILNADTVLLSKSDVAADECIEQSIELIKSIRPAARILRSQRGRVPLGMILDVGIRVSDGGKLKDEKEETHKHDHDHEEHKAHSHDHDHEGHSHEHKHGEECTDPTHDHSHEHDDGIEGFTTTSFKSDIALIPEKFMETFLQKLPTEVFRAKGLLHFHGFPQRIVFQLSGRRYSFEEDSWPENSVPGNQIVIIGKNINTEELRRNLEECHVEFVEE